MLQSTKTGSEKLELGGSDELTCRGSDIRTFVDLLSNVYLLDGPDRRAEPRIRITLPVVIYRLDGKFRRLEYPVRAVTRDISSRGVGLVCEDPVGTQFVTFKLESPCAFNLEVVAEVLRCDPVGYYFDVGCRFLIQQEPAT